LSDDLPRTEVSIRVRPSGPYVVEGAVRVVDHLGNEFVAPAGKKGIALCRCGHSAQRPFCDGSHRTCGFVADDVAGGP
jgi:CDGSH-type Zn-finger protein